MRIFNLLLPVSLLPLIFHIACYPDFPRLKITPCTDTISYQSTQICIPTVEGMTEYYNSFPNFPNYVDGSIPKGNKMLAYYTKTYVKPTSINFDVARSTPLYLIEDHDFFFIYTPETPENIRLNTAQFQAYVGNFSSKYKSISQKELDKILDQNPASSVFNEPRILADYAISPNSKTYISVVRTKLLIDTKIFLQAVNLRMIDGRLIVTTYYSVYLDEVSTKQIISHIDSISESIIQSNK